MAPHDDSQDVSSAEHGELSLPSLPEEPPASRYRGPRAERASLSAMAAEARERGDSATERSASIALVRLLAERGAEPRRAVTLIERALELGDDPELRMELSSRLAGLGDPRGAAAALHPLVKPAHGHDAVRLLVRVGVLRARGDDPGGARTAFEEAAALDPADPVPLEMVGALAGWSEGSVTRRMAAAAYLEAAARHERASAREAAFEDLLRAFEADPSSAKVADELAATLGTRGRSAAADEVRRVWAASLPATAADGSSPRRAAHLARMTEALARGDVALALGAGLDAGLDVTGPDAPQVDDLLTRAGLFELLGARPEARALDAEALEQLAAPLAPALRATMLAVAADARLLAGDLAAAKETAERACHADPALARPIAELAAIVAKGGDPAGAAPLERAMGVIVPRAVLASALADALDRAGEKHLALAWTQRWLALEPGNPSAIAEVLRRSAAARDAERLGDVLSWVLSQPVPVSRIDAGKLARGLSDLYALDHSRGLAIARRALDVFGPGEDQLRATLMELAEADADRSFSIAIVERWLATEEPAPTSAQLSEADLLLTLADRLRDVGDTVGELEAVLRALLAGAGPERVLARLTSEAPEGASDATLAWLEARAEALCRLPAERAGEAASAVRELGAARWDLAGDRAAAVRAWERAAKLDGARGAARFTSDLVAFGGAAFAASWLERRAESIDEPIAAAETLVTAATVALAHGDPDRALRDVDRATTLDPGSLGAIALAEHLATHDGADLLDAIYHRVARAALGCFGRRAAHHRAARQLERRDRGDLALSHAAAAFEAVPGDGGTFLLLARLAERAGDPTEAIRVVERVASATLDPDERAAWLKRAASLAGSGEEGLRRRIEVLLRALLARPEVSTFEALCRDAEVLATRSPDEAELWEMRVARAANAILPKLTGPEGARTGVAIARGMLDTFGAARLACRALGRALEADGTIDELGALIPSAPKLCADPDGAHAFVEQVLAAAKSPYASLGPHGLDLAAAMADGLGDHAAASAIRAEAARRSRGDLLETGPSDAADWASDEPAQREEGAGSASQPSVTSIGARLAAHLDEYRSRGGAGTPQEAHAVIDDLSATEGALSPDDAALRSFLLAEALDVVQGGGAGMRELSARHAEVGPLPLIALGLAERLVASSAYGTALPLFEHALDGDLRGVRKRASVVASAAEAASRAGDPERAERWLDEATSEPDPPSPARPDRASISPPASSLPFLAPPPGPMADAPALVHAPSAPSRPLVFEPPAPTPTPLPVAALAEPEPEPEPEPAPAPAPSSSDLLDALHHGSLDAGDQLAALYAASPSHSADLVNVRRLQAHLAPGDRTRLRHLHEAALADRDLAYARAVEHVLRAFDPEAGPLPPPPLAAQPEQPDAVFALIFRSPPHAGLEALAIACEGAPQLFRRDLASYGRSGVERIPLGSRSQVGSVYAVAARLLGLTRVPLFYVRTPGPPTSFVALVVPPAVVLSGDVADETPELRFEIGAALAAAMPECALVTGLPQDRTEALTSAVLIAYGPPDRVASPSAPVAVLAEALWQSLPPRSERRLRELCARDDGASLAWPSIATESRRLTRRAGLFVAGDIAVAIRRHFVDENLAPPEPLASPTGLSAACAAHPAIAELVRLATSPEYVRARWQPATLERRPSSLSSSKLRLGS